MNNYKTLIELIREKYVNDQVNGVNGANSKFESELRKLDGVFNVSMENIRINSGTNIKKVKIYDKLKKKRIDYFNCSCSNIIWC